MGGVHQEPIRRTRTEERRSEGETSESGRPVPDEGGRLLSLRNRSREERAIEPKRLDEGGTVTGSPMVPPSEGVTMNEEAYF